ncbi:hypothetical protein [Aureimonas sp. Leaf454]|uniref:hypothetical protein n=1 Tax=Aureimonas sp. Leaf454 TaxID=1736381 RepID=UPI000AF5DB04|nr:hypothetical protein [Aureimonas sp. Leaf454]
MTGDDKPGAGVPETLQEKSARLKAARLQAERDKDARIDRANRKASARRKVLGDDKR